MPAIVFDLDGTLIDSAPDIHAAVNRVLQDEGCAPLTLAETIGFIGHGLPTLVDRARAYRGLAAARQDDMVEAMTRHYGAASTALTRPYPGVLAALSSLRSAGYVIGVCTNKPIVATQRILADLGLADHMAAVVGGDSLEVKKPDPAPLRLAFDRLGRRALVYVGDSEVDAETARAAGVPFALFTRGYRKTPVTALPHRLAFEDFARLPALVSSLP
ncbi:phosphoglycolate phosphatase [Gemmobacter megaterium]|uniref:Phosphoglycolate phosphatase n=1 Tax=Gemmobacter megaterium TaxID=1086013 RepID=A0A1N7QK82_9RHOB|nr:phosphoglycolate phosphatase [Gemmobacter megaterium]GGE27700.1 phosphoglycolate phosphatase [Gemmobacter megaterium]SIT23290.1 phosphoglycolate phosphatase [Gemmobacter megaterium]